MMLLPSSREMYTTWPSALTVSSQQSACAYLPYCVVWVF